MIKQDIIRIRNILIALLLSISCISLNILPITANNDLQSVIWEELNTSHQSRSFITNVPQSPEEAQNTRIDSEYSKFVNPATSTGFINHINL